MMIFWTILLENCINRHFCIQTASVLQFRRQDHCCRGRSKTSCRIVGSHTKWELTIWDDFQFRLHRLLMSTGCKSSHNGFLDVSRSIGGLRISGWIGQLSCLTIFSTSLSVILDSTGSHGRGVERRVPAIRRMVEFNCTSTWLVWAQRDQTGAQYSAAE